MFCSRQSNSLINKIHERALSIVSEDYTSPFETLLVFNNQSTIHQKNLQLLMIEVYKYLHGLSPPIINDMFLRRDTKYNLKNFRELLAEKVTTAKYGTETVKRHNFDCYLEKLRTPNL